MASKPDHKELHQQLRRVGYSHYLRTGRIPMEIKCALGEEVVNGYWVKFNPYHDPDNGQFTFAPGHPNARSDVIVSRRRNALMPGQSAKPPAKLKPKPKPKPEIISEDLGALSASQESSGRQNPELVSTGVGDNGGVSYGTYQLSTNRGTAAEFIASKEAMLWAKEFEGLKPGSPAFNTIWKAIANRVPADFHQAQKAFVQRTLYDVAARKVKAFSNYDLDAGHSAIRQVTYSTAVQHGPSGGASVIKEAIRRTDKKLKRTDPRYESTLINNIYDRRTEIFIASSLRDKALSEKYASRGDRKNARKYASRYKVGKNVATIRFPRERKEALRLLNN